MNIHCFQIKIEQHYFWVNTYYSHDNNFQRFTNSFLSCLFTFFSLSIPLYLVYNSIWKCYAHNRYIYITWICLFCAVVLSYVPFLCLCTKWAVREIASLSTYSWRLQCLRHCIRVEDRQSADLLLVHYRAVQHENNWLSLFVVTYYSYLYSIV